MSSHTAFKPNTESGFDHLARMVTSSDPNVACMGRAFASEIGAALETWLRAEHERGTDPVVLLEIVAKLGLQHVASVAASVIAPGKEDAFSQIMGVQAQTLLPTYIRTIRAQEGGAA